MPKYSRLLLKRRLAIQLEIPKKSTMFWEVFLKTPYFGKKALVSLPLRPSPSPNLVPQLTVSQSPNFYLAQSLHELSTQPSPPSPPPSPTYIEVCPLIPKIPGFSSTLKRTLLSNFPPNKHSYMASDSQQPSLSLSINSIDRSFSTL